MDSTRKNSVNNAVNGYKREGKLLNAILQYYVKCI